MKKMLKFLLYAVLAIVGFFVVMMIIFSPPSPEKDPNAPDKTMACIMCQKIVEKNLKAPSTAKFQEAFQMPATVTDSTIVVQLWVDAQNSFGAMIRSHFECVTTHKGNIISVEELK